MWRKGALALVAAILVAVGFMASRYQTAVKTENAFADARDFPSELVGRPAPAFDLPGVSLSQFAGKTVLLTFWSSF